MPCVRALLELAPTGSGEVDVLERFLDAARGAELVDGPPGIRVAVVVDDDESPDRQAVVQNFECRVRRGVGARVDPQEGDLLDRRVRQRGRDLTLQEAHAIVEEVEARERVSDDVQIGPLVHMAPGRALGRSRCLRPREPAERIGHPDDLGGDLVRGKVTAHEDRAATTPGSALDEVAGHVLAANDFEARLEMLQPVMPHRRGREPRLRAGSRRTGASSNLELPREPEQEPLRVVQLCRLRSSRRVRRTGAGTRDAPRSRGSARRAAHP